MGLIGATTCSLLLFILPPVLHFLLYKENISKRAIILDVFLVILGMIAAFVGTKDAILRIKLAHA